jgi:hypothetical protein
VEGEGEKEGRVVGRSKAQNEMGLETGIEIEGASRFEREGGGDVEKDAALGPVAFVLNLTTVCRLQQTLMGILPLNCLDR